MVRSLMLVLQALLCISSATALADTATFLNQPFTAGINHVDGRYSFWGNNFLIEGGTKINQMETAANQKGRGIFIYIDPAYATHYPQKSGPYWGTGISNLTQLAQSAPYKQLFGMSYTQYVMTTNTFAHDGLGNFDPAKLSSTQINANAAAVQNEIKNFAYYLLTTYKGTGKTFILKNWEGDWNCLGYAYGAPWGAHSGQNIPSNVISAFTTWIKARQAGVAAARSAAGNPAGVSVLLAVEVNRVLDVNLGLARLTNKVLPNVYADMVTYSSYDAVYGNGASNQSGLQTDLTTAFGLIYKYAHDPLGLGKKRLMISELGLAENSLGQSQTQMRASTTLNEAISNGLSGVYIWDLYDNECYPGGNSSNPPFATAMQPPPPNSDCHGFWIIRPDGTTSWTYATMLQTWQKLAGSGGTGSNLAVKITAPSGGTTATNPVTVKASITQNSDTVAYSEVWIGSTKYCDTSGKCSWTGTSIAPSIKFATGSSKTITVASYDSTGHKFTANVTVNIK